MDSVRAEWNFFRGVLNKFFLKIQIFAKNLSTSLQRHSGSLQFRPHRIWLKIFWYFLKVAIFFFNFTSFFKWIRFFFVARWITGSKWTNHGETFELEHGSKWRNPDSVHFFRAISRGRWRMQMKTCLKYDKWVQVSLNYPRC